MVKCLQFRIVTRAGTSRLLKISVTDPGPGVLAPAGDVIAGYYAVDPLTSADLALAAEFIVARVAARIIVSQRNALREPANQGYLIRRTPQAIEHFAALGALTPDEIARALRGM